MIRVRDWALPAVLASGILGGGLWVHSGLELLSRQEALLTTHLEKLSKAANPGSAVSEAWLSEMQDSRKAIATHVATTRQQLLLGVSALALLSLFVGFLVSRRTRRGAERLLMEADRLVSGSGADTQAFSRELGGVGDGLIRLVDHFHESLTEVGQAARIVAQNLEQIGAGTEELAQTSKIQASTAADTTRAVEQMARNGELLARNASDLSAQVELTSTALQQIVAGTSSVVSNADVLSGVVNQMGAAIQEMSASIDFVAQNVREAANDAVQTSEAAREGREAVDATVAGIQDVFQVMSGIRVAIDLLGQRSKQIGTILGVMEDIAAQTNMLALNASIEAARAGEAGRGFSIVAVEVRKMADRAAASTAEIRDLVKAIQTDTQSAMRISHEGELAISAGADVAGQAGYYLETIVKRIEDLATRISVIDRATHEHAIVARDTLSATERLDQGTRRMTESAHQQDVASQRIGNSAAAMRDVVLQVASSSLDQQNQAREMVTVIQGMNFSAQESAIATDTIAQSAVILQNQAHRLLEVLRKYDLHDEHTVSNSRSLALR
ncbi:MAG: methyl-accepting chemotaxis protein [bacterium]|nr:methyl-accepting chemotaxis protein [bacterium]